MQAVSSNTDVCSLSVIISFIINYIIYLWPARQFKIRTRVGPLLWNNMQYVILIAITNARMLCWYFLSGHLDRTLIEGSCYDLIGFLLFYFKCIIYPWKTFCVEKQIWMLQIKKDMIFSFKFKFVYVQHEIIYCVVFSLASSIFRFKQHSFGSI